MHIGKAIKWFQVEKRVPSVMMAKSLGVTPQQFSRWRASKDLKLSIVVASAAVLGVSPGELIDRAKCL